MPNARVNSQMVKDILESNYDSGNNPNLSPFMRTASVLVARLVREAEDYEFSSDELREIELYLSAHFYMCSDKGYQSRSTMSASATFQGQTGKMLESSDYGQQAILLDGSGILQSLAKRETAGGFWGGKPESEQLSYDERNY